MKLLLNFENMFNVYHFGEGGDLYLLSELRELSWYLP